MEFSRRHLLKASVALAFWPVPPPEPDPVVPPPVAAPALSFRHRRYCRRRCSSACVGPYADAVLTYGEPPALEAGAFTIAVLPDTQHYSDQHPETFLAQTNWIADNQQTRNIACVLHLGDVTEHNLPDEWEIAVRAMQQLDGKVPYFMVPGNHDYGERGQCQDRTSLLSKYFPVSQLHNAATFGGVYDREPDRVENSFHLLDAGGRKLLVLGLEFGPRKDVVRWANEVAEAHADREIILLTHAFAYFNSTRYDWKKFGHRQQWNPHTYQLAELTDDDVSDGEELWTNLVSRHENFLLTLNGHVLGSGLGHVTTPTPAGKVINQLLVNFQMRPRGGDGWLRLLEFRPNGVVQVYDYSPTRDQRNESKKNQFTFTVPTLA